MKTIGMVLLLLICPMAAASTLGSIGKVLLRSMDGTSSTVPSGLVMEHQVIARHKGFERAAVRIGRDMQPAEREKAAELLENLLIREYGRRGFTQSMMLACRSCVPTYLADDIDARAIDLLAQYTDLVAKISLDSTDITILDSSGQPITSSAAQRAALNLLERDLSMAARSAERGAPDSFYDSLLKRLKSVNADISIDAEAGTLAVRGTAGAIKGSIVNLDLNAFLGKMKNYLFGGGLGALGYGAISSTGDDKKEPVPPVQVQRMGILSKLSSQERARLMERAEAEYIYDLYQQAYLSSAETAR
ncbi:MAG: hypothetical protein ACK4VV_12065 [Pseudomonas sp.]